MKNPSPRSFACARFSAGLIALLLIAVWPGCNAPDDNQNQNQNENGGNTNDNGGGQLQGFPFDVELGRSGPLALPTDNCSEQVVSTTTGSGTFESSVVTSETVAQPYIHMQVSAPKGTDGGVIITDCGLQGRFAITPSSTGATTATGDISVTIRVDADQNGEAAGGYSFAIGMSLLRVSSTSPDVVPPTDLGYAEKMYCMLPLTCTDPLPDENGFVGMQRIGLSLDNIELNANAEYIVYVAVGGSIVSAKDSPDLLGGSVILRATVESLDLTFINDDQDEP